MERDGEMGGEREREREMEQDERRRERGEVQSDANEE